MKDLPKVMESFVISHGILLILPPNFTKCVQFFADGKKFSKTFESLLFLTFSAKYHECKSGLAVAQYHGNLRNGHGKVKS